MGIPATDLSLNTDGIIIYMIGQIVELLFFEQASLRNSTNSTEMIVLYLDIL